MSQTYVYVLLTNTRSTLCKSIQKFTQAPYNHASISLDPYLNEVYSFGRKKNNPFFAGFVHEDILNGSFKLFPDTTCVLYKVPVTFQQTQEVEAMINFFKQNRMKYKYNFIGLINIALHISYNRKNAYFCSEFVSEVLKKADIIHTSKPNYFITPDDFRKHFEPFSVYSGLLYEYPLLMAS